MPFARCLHVILTTVAMQGGGDEDGKGDGSDIGALLGNLGPLLGGLSGVSCCLDSFLTLYTHTIVTK